MTSTTSQSFESYQQLLIQSGLIAPQQLKELLAEMGPEQTADLPGHRRLAKVLIDRGLLTPWQDRRLMKGQYDGFFIASYKLIERLGSGGMGHVYLAEHTMIRRPVALKILPSKFSKNPIARQRLEQESRALGSIDHPHVVKLYDAGQYRGLWYLAMEYIDGMDLQQHVETNGPLAPRMAAEVIRQAAIGLATMHDTDLIHRDIKPSNLCLNQEKQIKVLDLGVARLSDDDSSSMTVAHKQQLLGTIDYLAPEQALDSHRVDDRADIYSLGCTLYFLLSGESPFSGGSQAERILMHQMRQPTPLPSLRPEVPASLWRLCEWLMRKQPAERPSALEVSRAFADWLQSDRTPPPEEEFKSHSLPSEDTFHELSIKDTLRSLSSMTANGQSLELGSVVLNWEGPFDSLPIELVRDEVPQT